ncbi:MAG: 4Fe-4S binding protein [Planctomycetota bacterium]|jgi:ferredoxin-type protein NapH
MKGHQIRHLGVQVIRRGIQVAVLVLLVGIVYISLYAHYRAARALDDPQLMDGWKGHVISIVDEQVSQMDDPQAFLDGCKGTLWSMRIGGIDLTDPLAAVEMIAASKTIYGPILLSALIPTIVTLILGRVFCSWICPAGILLEITGKLRKLLKFAEIPPAEVRFSHKNKYFLLAIGILMVTLIGLPIFALVYPPVVLGRMIHAWIFGTSLTGMFLLITAIIVFELFVSPRWFCRTMCPGAALYALIGWLRLLRVKLNTQRCTSCNKCIPVCEPGIDPVRESAGIECDNCGVCIRHCPEGALYYTIGLPGSKNDSMPGQNKDDTEMADNSEEHIKNNRQAILMTSIIVFLVLFPTAPAKAHHILGLPHYSYKENYPQVPTLEYPATTGPYDVLLTSYPGKPVPGEPANLAFYIKNRNTNTPYERPITVRVLQTFTFGRNREILPATVVEPFEQPHKISTTFSEDGEYIVELHMEVEGATEVIPFLMIAGDPSATVSIIIAIGAVLLIFIIIIRAIKIKRERRAAKQIPVMPETTVNQQEMSGK